ncbi:high frequency lysogenization protein HflD [Motiliproteus sediminis]|uniref:high frequency lysogenization protein HflD n=1 Tax=Motiliproteus sediminis TaxID=1468178 RepID=UPI001AEFC6CE|nr:high frequency lysogenization protein HflD [Motiliproteus sediminis]
MSRQQDEQAIALAGIFQAAALVDQVARRGLIPQNEFEASVNSIFITNPSATEDVYGGVSELPYNLQLGLKQVRDLASKKSPENKEITRYALSMLHLESRLRKHPQMLDSIASKLETVRQQSRFYDRDNADDGAAAEVGSARFSHPAVIANIANLYQETISTFSFRIQVTGEPRHLQNQDNANKVRALLLAGIRAAILWHQVGGRRWHLLFFRSRAGRSAERILNQGRS